MSKKLVCTALVAIVGLSGASAARAQCGGKVSFMPAPFASGLSYVDRTGKVTPVPRRPAGTTYTPAPAKTMPVAPRGLKYVNLFSDVEIPVPRRPAGTIYTPAPVTKYPYGKPRGLSYVSLFSDVEIPVPRRPWMPPTSTVTPTQPRPGVVLSPWTTKHR